MNKLYPAGEKPTINSFSMGIGKNFFIVVTRSDIFTYFILCNINKEVATMNIYNPSKTAERMHVHEFLGSTGFAEPGEERHNHRFAGVTGEAIPLGNGRHVHEFRSNTDFVENHIHVVQGKTGPDIMVGDNKHIHFVDSFTTVDEGHRHRFTFATLIGPSSVE
jgi:hypothetical protein